MTQSLSHPRLLLAGLVAVLAVLGAVFAFTSMTGAQGSGLSVSATKIGCGGMEFSWNPVEGATSYDLEHKRFRHNPTTWGIVVNTIHTGELVWADAGEFVQLRVTVRGGPNDGESFVAGGETGVSCWPTNLSATPVGCGQLEVSWDSPRVSLHSPNARAVVRHRVAGTFAFTEQRNLRSPMLLSGLEPGVLYEIRVMAQGATVDDDIATSATSARAGNTNCPTQATATGTGCGALRVDVQLADGATGFQAAMIRLAGDVVDVQEVTSGNSVTLTGFTPGWRADVIITTRGGPNNGSTLKLDSITTGDDCPTGRDANPTATTGSSCGEINVSWTAVPTATHYFVEWQYADTSNPSIFSTGEHAGNSTSYTLTGRVPGRLYNIRVASVVDGTRLPSNPVRNVEANDTACQPTVSATGQNCGEVAVSWTGTFRAYHVHWRHNLRDDADWTNSVLVSPAKSYILTDLSPGGVVLVGVTPRVNAAADADITAIVRATAGSTGCDSPSPAPSEALRAQYTPQLTAWTGLNCGQIILAWQRQDNVVGSYTARYQYADTANTHEWTQGLQYRAGSTRAQLQNLEPGRAYNVRIDAYSFIHAQSYPSNVISNVVANHVDCRPEQVVASGSGCGDVDATWVRAFTDRYSVQVREGSGPWSSAVSVTQQVAHDTYFHKFTGLTSGASVSVRVTAVMDTPAGIDLSTTVTGTAGSICGEAPSATPTLTLANGSACSLVSATLTGDGANVPVDWQWREPNSRTWQAASFGPGEGVVLGALPNGVDVEIRAVGRSSGDQLAVSTIRVSPCGPTPVLLTPLNCGEVAIDWLQNQAGNPSFTVEWRRLNGTWAPASTVPNERFRIVRGLNPNERIEVRVTVHGGPSNGMSDTAFGEGGNINCDAPAAPTLTAPTVTAATSGTSCGSLSVTWTPGEGATGFWLEWAPSGSANDPQAWIRGSLFDAAARSGEITGLVAGQSYNVRVIAVDDSGAHAASSDRNNVAANSADCQPAAPTLTAPALTGATTGSTCGNLSATWTPGEGAAATAFALEWQASDTSSPQSWTRGSRLGAHARLGEVTGLDAGRNYNVRVVAIGDDGAEAASTSRNNVTAAYDDCWSRIGTGMGPGDNCGELDIYWNRQQPRVTRSTVYWRPYGSSDPWTVGQDLVSSTSSGRHVISGLVPGGHYTVRVGPSAIPVSDHAPYYRLGGVAGGIRANNEACAAPAPTALATSCGEALITWADVPLATGYTLQWQQSASLRSPAGIWSTAVAATSPQRVSGLAPGSNVNVRVTAQFPGGPHTILGTGGRGGAHTTTGTVTGVAVSGCRPVVKADPGNGCGEINIGWNSDIRSATYTLQWRASGSRDWTELHTESSSGTLIWTGQTPGAVLEVRVSAINADTRRQYTSASVEVTAGGRPGCTPDTDDSGDPSVGRPSTGGPPPPVIPAVSGVSGAGGASGSQDDADADFSVLGEHCLSNLTEFASWRCTVDSTLAEFFPTLQALGAHSVSIWDANAQQWRRYATVGDALIPGTEDWPISRFDILHIHQRSEESDSGTP